MDRQFSFIIALPMYNEEDYAENCVRSIFSVLDGIPGRNAVVAINDGSRDRTLEILTQLKSEFPRLEVVDHPVNRGYGGAIRSAYDFAVDHGFDYVLFMDADMTQDPRYILSFLPFFEQGVDVIKASRYISGSHVVGVPSYRVMISTVGNLVARLAFRLPLTDYTNGFRAIRSPVAEQFNLSSNHFEILVEEMWQARFLTRKFAEVCYTLSARPKSADSKFSYNWKVYRQYLKYCYYALMGIKPRLKEKTIHLGG